MIIDPHIIKFIKEFQACLKEIGPEEYEGQRREKLEDLRRRIKEKMDAIECEERMKIKY